MENEKVKKIKRHKMTEEKRQKIIEELKAGTPQTEISKKYNTAYRTIQKIISEEEQKNNTVIPVRKIVDKKTQEIMKEWDRMHRKYGTNVKKEEIC